MTLIVIKRPLDTVTADATFSDTATPDPVAELFKAFSPFFKGITVNTSTKGLQPFETVMMDDFTFPAASRARPVLAQLKWIYEQQVSLQKTLTKSNDDIAKPAADAVKAFLAKKTEETCAWNEASLALEKSKLKGLLDNAATMDTGSGLTKGLHEATENAAKTYAALAVNPNNENLSEIGRVLNEIVALQTEIDSSSASPA